MPNANPEEFAKIILWQLAGLQADTQLLRRHLHAQLALQTPNPPQTAQDSEKLWLTMRNQLQQEIYQKTAQQAGLTPAANTPPEESAPPTTRD